MPLALLFVLGPLFHSVAEAQDACNCRETDLKIVVEDPNGHRAVFCGWSEVPAKPAEELQGPVTMVTIKNCSADTMMWKGAYDEETQYFVRAESAKLFLSKTIALPLGPNWAPRSVPFTEYTISSDGSGYSADSGRYAFKPPRIVGALKDSILAYCRVAAGAIGTNAQVKFPGGKRALQAIFLGAVGNVNTARWLFVDLKKTFALDDALVKLYDELKRVYSVVALHEGFDKPQN